MSISVGLAPPPWHTALVGCAGQIQFKSQPAVPGPYRSCLDGRRTRAPVEHLGREALVVSGPSDLHVCLAGGVLAGADLLPGSARKSDFYGCHHNTNISDYFTDNFQPQDKEISRKK